MDAESIIDWSEKDADDHVMDGGPLYAKILEFQNEFGHPFLYGREVQNVVTLHFDNQNFEDPSMLLHTVRPSNGRPTSFPETLPCYKAMLCVTWMISDNIQSSNQFMAYENLHEENTTLKAELLLTKNHA